MTDPEELYWYIWPQITWNMDKINEWRKAGGLNPLNLNNESAVISRNQCWVSYFQKVINYSY